MTALAIVLLVYFAFMLIASLGLLLLNLNADRAGDAMGNFLQVLFSSCFIIAISIVMF